MNLQQMHLSQQALGKLSQLAMAVELHEHKRFSLRKDIDQVIGLLKVASNSTNNVIQEKLDELSGSLTSDSVGFFRTLGISLDLPKPAVKGQQTYRGQSIAKADAPTTNAAPEKMEPTDKKKIIYRGKVIYR